MRKSARHSVTLLVLLFLLTSVLSCGSNAGGGQSLNEIPQAPLEEMRASEGTGSQNPLVGTWVSGAYRLIFKADSTYSREFNQDIPAVEGNARVSGNVIIVNDDSGGRDSCFGSATGEVVSGTYTYTIKGNALTFDRFHDPCRDRAAFFGFMYTRR